MVNILHIIYASIYFYLVYMGYYITYKMSRINRGKATPKNTLNTQPLTSSAMETDAIEQTSMHQEAMENENKLHFVENQQNDEHIARIVFEANATADQLARGHTVRLSSAENIFNTSELAGIVFSPNQKVLFLNIYKPTMTLAIEGPWNKL